MVVEIVAEEEEEEVEGGTSIVFSEGSTHAVGLCECLISILLV